MVFQELAARKSLPPPDRGGTCAVLLRLFFYLVIRGLFIRERSRLSQ
jgi:hypothetical protein